MSDGAGVRRRLDGLRGRQYWRSLDELAGSPEFLERLGREFPEQAATFDDPAGRREFLRLMGASLALAGVGAACTRQPDEAIVPYVRSPEDVVPGRPLYFATALSESGYARGVLVESHMGRPTKVEGNPDHPASLGATDAQGQAAVLGLYDPDRAQTLTHRGEISTPSAFLTAMKTALEAQRALRGAGLRILTETVTSPTLAGQIAALLAELPLARWHCWDPLARDRSAAGARLAFGERVDTHYRLDSADIVLSLDADFLSGEPGSLRYVREFARRRKPAAGSAGPGMNRLYAVESVPSLTGSMADHRLPLRASEIEGFARAVAAGLGLAVEGGTSHPWVAPLVADLERHAGRTLVLVGESQPPVVHALAHVLNHRLGNVGRTLVHTSAVAAGAEDHAASLRELVADLGSGRVDLLLVLGGNPVYTAPADLGFAAALDGMPAGAQRVHLSLYHDETSERCHWHVPQAHALETWSDLRAFDGTVSLVQPLIAPLYPAARSAHELLAALTPTPERPGYEILQGHWRTRLGSDFERAWRRALHDGVVPGTAFEPRAVVPRLGDWARAAPAAAASGLELNFRPDPSVGDGRHANNGWLQELPKPLTKLTWDNAALIGPRTAERVGVAARSATSHGVTADVVELRYRGRTLRAPVWVSPGHPEGSVTVHLGYGRRRAGRVGTGLGFDAFALRTADAPWFGSGLELVRTGDTYLLAGTQDHWAIEADREAHARHLIRPVTLEQYVRDPGVVRGLGHDPDPALTLYPPHPYEGHAWGMSIDLSACVGCNACVVACQSENNIPVVGKDQVARGREMHWIRIDRYHGGDPLRSETVETHHQPVPCMHCENAPCEVVCPVAATVHSDEGLNDMVYNRCVGTRYCSNNCPYKVRRFNFFLYQDWSTRALKPLRNPDVTVRSRGVMEKCTYCVQRINQARIEARNHGRPIADGEIRPACEQACPAQAIVFGDINDPASRVARAKAEARSYGLLTDLNTRPRTTYLAQIRNPNPEMPGV